MKRRSNVRVKKLRLRKDTLKRLSDGSLREVAGGFTDQTACWGRCTFGTWYCNYG